MSRQSLVSSFANAASGILQAALHERNFKIELGFAVAAIIFGLVLQIDFTQWAVIFVCFGMVLGGECVNTALEATVDLASPEYNELAKRAKDCAAGAVLVASIASLLVAAAIFLPLIVSRIFA